MDFWAGNVCDLLKERPWKTKGLVTDAIVYFVASIPVAALGTLLLWIAWHFIPSAALRLGMTSAYARIVEIFTWGPPTIMLCFGICISVWLGLVGRAFFEPSREWWASPVAHLG